MKELGGRSANAKLAFKFAATIWTSPRKLAKVRPRCSRHFEGCPAASARTRPLARRTGEPADRPASLPIAIGNSYSATAWFAPSEEFGSLGRCSVAPGIARLAGDGTRPPPVGHEGIRENTGDVRDVSPIVRGDEGGARTRRGQSAALTRAAPAADGGNDPRSGSLRRRAAQRENVRPLRAAAAAGTRHQRPRLAAPSTGRPATARTATAAASTPPGGARTPTRP